MLFFRDFSSYYSYCINKYYRVWLCTNNRNFSLLMSSFDPPFFSWPLAVVGKLIPVPATPINNVFSKIRRTKKSKEPVASQQLYIGVVLSQTLTAVSFVFLPMVFVKGKQYIVLYTTFLLLLANINMLISGEIWICFTLRF